MADEFGYKTRGGSVIQMIGISPLRQLPLLNHTNHIANGKSFHLVVRDKKRRGIGCFQNRPDFKG